MSITDLFTPDIATFIREVGFPAFAFLIVIYLVQRMIKKDEKRQLQSDQNYKELVKEFIDKMESITRDHTDALREISSTNKTTSVEIRNNREMCIRDREITLNRILEEITEVKDVIKDKYNILNHKNIKP